MCFYYGYLDLIIGLKLPKYKQQVIALKSNAVLNLNQSNVNLALKKRTVDFLQNQLLSLFVFSQF